MAATARNSRMLSSESKARLAMIDGLTVRLPMNELKIGAVMVRMARRALVACSLCIYPDRVHSALLVHTLANFCVAFQALQLRGPVAEVMAFGAICGTRERLMSFR